jgi:hypothetical protein
LQTERGCAAKKNEKNGCFKVLCCVDLRAVLISNQTRNFLFARKFASETEQFHQLDTFLRERAGGTTVV